MSTCISEPVSFLTLERYALGELPRAEGERVAEHLQRCVVCRDCYERIQADPRALEVDALSARLAGVTAGQAAAPLRAARKPTARRVAAALGFSVVCALFLVVLRPNQRSATSPDLEPPSSSKGDTLALEVVREDGQGRLLEPTHFADGDRFKLLLSCPEGRQGTVRVLAFQSGEVYEPVPAQELPSCGNRRALKGAWQLDGEAAVDLCVVFVRGGRSLQSARSVAELAEEHVCARLERMDAAKP